MTRRQRCFFLLSPALHRHVVVPVGTGVGGGELQEVEVPGTADSLRAALYPQLATEVIDVPFHRVHAQHEALGNLAVGGALKQQP